MRELANVTVLLDGYAGPEIVTEALRSAGLDRAALALKSSYVPYAAEAILIEAVARAIGDRHLGARLGRDFDYSSYGAFAGYVLGAPDLGTALDRGRRALILTHPGAEISMRQTRSHLVVGRDSSGLSVTGHRHLDEGALFVIRTVVRHFLGPQWNPDWVEVPPDNPRSLERLEKLVGAPVRPRDGAPGVAVRLADLEALNPSKAPPAATISLDELAALMGVSPVQTVTDAVTQILEITISDPATSEKTVARHLAISARTLQRALSREGTSFSVLRAHFAEQKACHLLARTDIPIEGIAFALGYKDARSFRRAFNRWQGVSPNAYRRAKAPER